jgi:hypothetical protein
MDTVRCEDGPAQPYQCRSSDMSFRYDPSVTGPRFVHSGTPAESRSVLRTGAKAMTDQIRHPWSRGEKIALYSLVVALVGVAVIPGLKLIDNGNWTKSTPMATLTTFCESLRGEDYRTAYNQHSRRMQAEYARDGGLPSVAAGWRSNNGHGVVVDCSAKGADNDGSILVNSVLWVYADQAQARFHYGLVKEDGEWKIDQWSPL